MQFLSEVLDHGVLEAQVWLNTRDMFADGLTKGAIPGDAPFKILDGVYSLEHEPKVWRPKVRALAP